MNAQAALIGLQGDVFRTARAGRLAGRAAGKLMPWLLDGRNLRSAWERVSSADGAQTPGVDGVTCGAIFHRWEAWLGALGEDLRRGRYQPKPPRWVMVPKASRPGAYRRLGVLTVRDRVVHAALKQVLEPVLEPVFRAGSFGFRPGRSVCGALGEAVRLLSPSPAGGALPFGFAVHLDVADCFDTIDHEMLLEGLRTLWSEDTSRSWCRSRALRTAKPQAPFRLN
jgi:retron-type reverse transcriptase